MAVRADGVMVPCSQLPHMELGRINQDDLGEVWRHHPELTRLRQRSRIPLSDFDFCRDCEYLHYCSGGCPALAFTRTNLEDSPVPDSCFRNFLAQGGQLPDART
jgi:radical SAM protein with 4Fe4S-binding SPASM domain